MTNTRSCGAGHHTYVTTGNRSKCSRCGSVQIDLTGNENNVVVDPTKVFVARRPTLFSLKFDEAEAASEAPFGRARRHP